MARLPKCAEPYTETEMTRKLQNGNIPVPETVEQERYYISGSKKS